MVRSESGGKHKFRARKDAAPPTSNKLRVAEEGALYAVVVKMLGDGACHVECSDGAKRLCHFRGKFSGKNKKQNEVSLNTWVMIGAREWESEKPGKLGNCDLMEVYSENHKKQLKTVMGESWKKLAKHDASATAEAPGESIFKTEAEEEYDQLMDKFVQDGSDALAIKIDGEGDSSGRAVDAKSALEQLKIDVMDI
jgi:initiation factor 1A